MHDLRPRQTIRACLPLPHFCHPPFPHRRLGACRHSGRMVGRPLLWGRLHLLSRRAHLDPQPEGHMRKPEINGRDHPDSVGADRFRYLASAYPGDQALAIVERKEDSPLRSVLDGRNVSLGHLPTHLISDSN